MLFVSKLNLYFGLYLLNLSRSDLAARFIESSRCPSQWKSNLPTFLKTARYLLFSIVNMSAITIIEV